MLTASPLGGFRGLVALLFAFACACPLLLLGGVNLRLSDLACLAAAAALGVALMLRPRLHHCAAALGVASIFSFGWIAAEAYYPSFMEHDPPSTMILVRWLIAFPAAYWLCVLTDDVTLRRAAMLGLILGWMTDTVLLAYDFYAFSSTGQPAFGAAESHVFWVGGAYRAIGLFGHANGAAIASLFVVPFLIGYAGQFGRGVLAGALGWIAIGLVFFLTRSRGATISAAGLLAWWMVSARPRRVAFGALALLAGSLAVIALWPSLLDTWLGGDQAGALLSRFTDSGSIEENSEGRIDTAIGALQLAFTHPLGMGSSFPPALEALTRFGSTPHNALLQLADIGGPLLSLSCLGVLLAGASRAFYRNARTEDHVALYFLLVSMFEAHFFNPMTSIILLWLVGRLGPRLLPAGPATQDSGHREAIQAGE